MFFLDFFCGGIVSCFSAETTVGANVGGPKIRWGPWTQELRTRVTNESAQVTKSGETKNLRKPELASKVVNPFTCALAPPFIGRREDFYIPRLPSNLRNIPNVNTYKNVFYIPWFAGLISYIYKSATIHTLNLDFWSDFFDLASSWPRSSYSLKSPLTVIPELRLHQIPELRRFLIPWTSPISNHPEMDSRFANRSLIRLLFSCIIRRSAECMRFIRISSWIFPSHETELSTPKVIHEVIHEFGKSDVSRV
jgi:hypothetical protein